MNKCNIFLRSLIIIGGFILLIIFIYFMYLIFKQKKETYSFIESYFINLDKRTGNIIWSTNILKVLKKKKQNTDVTGFILGSGKIYATTKNGYLITSSADFGKVESFKKIGDEIYASPIIHDGALFILTEDSRIFGLN